MRAALLILLLADTAQAASLDALLPFRARAGGPGRDRYLPIVQAEAAKQGVPPELADAVAMVETGYSENAVGTSGEIGLMQIMPATAAMLGFAGSTGDLFKPETNIHFGVAYLARAWAASGGNICRALMKYRAGVGEENYSPLSIQYCQRASTWLTAQNTPLAPRLAASIPPGPSYGAADDPHVIRVASALGRPFHPDLQAIAEIAGMPEMAPARGRTGAHAPRGRAVAVMDAIAASLSDAAVDPHVIHVGAE